MDNEFFSIVNDSLFSNAIFDFEDREEYQITVGVFNQLGETSTNNFTITIEDVLTEDVQTIEILEDTLSSLYYHQENFTQPTKLVFPNLTAVTGIAYFYENVNLISVELPQLSYVGDYFYFQGNEVLESVSAPVLDTIHNYLYASQNTKLAELEICSLTHIISTDPDSESYYYIKNNPILDFTSTCLDSTILEFMPEDSLVLFARILVGRFQSNTLDPMIYYINDNGIDVTETEDFIIEEEGIYLKKDIVEYDQDSYPISITSYRMDQNSNTMLNEQILFDLNLKVKDKVIVTSAEYLANKEEIKCYPNPTSSIINVKVDQPGIYTLYNQYGVVVKTFNLTIGLNQVDVKKMLPNIYYLYSDFGHLVRIIKL